MSVFICEKDAFAVFDKFLPGFNGSHMVNLQFLRQWTYEMARFWSRTVNSPHIFIPDKILLLVYYTVRKEARY